MQTPRERKKRMRFERECEKVKQNRSTCWIMEADCTNTDTHFCFGFDVGHTYTAKGKNFVSVEC